LKLAIVGSRSFTDYACLEKTLFDLIKIDEVELIISGGAKGTDTLAEQFAKKHGIETLVFKPNWEEYGKSAGYKRNVKIVEAADEVIAFWRDSSPGTKISIDLAKKLNKKLLVKLLPSDEISLDIPLDL
jgi:hypothetical protein